MIENIKSITSFNFEAFHAFRLQHASPKWVCCASANAKIFSHKRHFLSHSLTQNEEIQFIFHTKRNLVFPCTYDDRSSNSNVIVEMAIYISSLKFSSKLNYKVIIEQLWVRAILETIVVWNEKWDVCKEEREKCKRKKFFPRHISMILLVVVCTFLFYFFNLIYTC